MMTTMTRPLILLSAARRMTTTRILTIVVTMIIVIVMTVMILLSVRAVVPTMIVDTMWLMRIKMVLLLVANDENADGDSYGRHGDENVGVMANFS